MTVRRTGRQRKGGQSLRKKSNHEPASGSQPSASPAGILDELNDIIAALSCVPHLRRTASGMADLIRTSTHRQRMLFDFVGADAVDMEYAAQMIVAASHVRLMRLRAKIEGGRP
jgi:hypothetical protein